MSVTQTFPSLIFNKMRNPHIGVRLNDAWNAISQMPIEHRKFVVLLCRAQEVVIDDPSNLLCIQTGLTDSSAYAFGRPSDNIYRLFVDKFRDFIMSPILSSVVLDMCRSAPMSESQVQEAKLKSWGKEVAVCEREERPRSFDYSCWFDPNCFDRPLIAGTPPNPEMAYTVYRSLVSWRQKCTERLLYPRMSKKLISRDTIRQWEWLNDRDWVIREKEGGVEMTQEHLERFYHDTGVVIQGCCEIRQKWYKSGVTPRTYFSQGGTSYSLSKYIQEIAGLLTEQLPVTDPISRLNPARIKLGDDRHYLRIYDLSSFTSNHWECKYYVDSLSRFCSGYDCHIMDAREGVVVVDLGHLISVYNQMNMQPEYSMDQIGREYRGHRGVHNQAGFLGVYGNINFSTALHGSSILMAVSSVDEANCAGDDGHYKEQSGYEDVANRLIRGNGAFEETKTFRSDEIGAVCLKRGVIQVEGKVLPKVMLVFPSFSNIGLLFDYHTNQFPDEGMTRKEARGLVGTEVFRFLRGVFMSQISEDLDIVLDLLHAVYESAYLPVQGSFPPYGDYLMPVLPTRYQELLEYSPLDLLMRNHFSEGAELPRTVDDLEGDFETGESQLVVGGEWEGPMTKHLKYLEVLGYVRSEEQTELVFGEVAYDRLVAMYSGELRSVYSFLCIADVPDHLLIPTFP